MDCLTGKRHEAGGGAQMEWMDGMTGILIQAKSRWGDCPHLPRLLTEIATIYRISPIYPFIPDMNQVMNMDK